MLQLNDFTYFIFLLVVGLVPISFSLFHKELHFYKQRKQAITSILLAAVIFIIWDIWAVARDHWEFSEQYITGLKIATLPIEEILFFLVIPWACFVIWLEIKYFVSFSDLWIRFKKGFGINTK